MPEKNFLVPIDFSKASESALQFAIGFNGYFGGKIHFLHIFELPFASSPETISNLDYFEKLQINSQKDTVQFVDNLKGNVEFESVVTAVTGGHFQAIAHYAQQNLIDVIISGNKQKSSLANWFTGSITKHLLAEAPCPVIAVPEHYVWKPLKTIAVFVDLSEKISTANCHFIQSLQKDTKATLIFLHVENKIEAELEDDTEKLQQIQDVFKQTAIMLPFNESFEHSIHTYLNENPADMLVTIPHHHTWLDKLFLGTETGTIAKWANVPIMSLVRNIPE